MVTLSFLLSAAIPLLSSNGLDLSDILQNFLGEDVHQSISKYVTEYQDMGDVVW
jgi:hypothetical protein